MILVRQACSSDWHAIGTLVQESIFEAPSSHYGFSDLPQDALKLGQQIVRLGDSDMGGCLVADTHIGLAGICQVLRGEFERCRHAALLSLLVHPVGRNQGIGRELLRQMENRFMSDRSILKVTIQIAETDVALIHLVGTEGWRLERVSPNALDLGRHRVALHHYALDLGNEFNEN
jgi:ribosomal protein S18 acetylase RimI-like enzyme